MQTIYKTFALTILASAAVVVPSFAQETKWLAVLNSQATVQEKSAACRELARVATKKSVPALASLLGDEKLSHMARYALESIRDPSVDDALRDALGKVQGRPRLGVIGSLGARHDAKAVAPLAALLKGDDADAAQAAARALGNIGAPAAAKALQDALPGTSGTTQIALSEGLLRAAESLQAQKQTEPAKAIYDQLRALAGATAPVRAAALRGAMLVRGKASVPLLHEAIQGSDKALTAAAIRAAMELPYPEITDALAAELPKASADRQDLLILSLADRGDSRVLPIVLQAAKNGQGQHRIVALRALKRVGDASCAPALLDAALSGGDDVSKAAIETIEILKGNGVDDLIVSRLATAQGKSRIVLMDLASRRHTAAAAPAFWLGVDDKDPTVRAAALAGLGAVVEPAGLPKLLNRFATAKDDKEAVALNKALQEVCLRTADRDATAEKLAAALQTASGSLKGKLLETLNVVGGKKSLEIVATAALSKDAELRAAAFRVLGQWMSTDAAPVLLDLYRTTGDERLKIGALRGYIRIARQFDMPADRRAAMCRTAMELAQRKEEKRLVLEVLVRYPGKEMRAIAQESLKNPDLQGEASFVLMAMAHGGSKNRADFGKALAQASHTKVKLEIVKAEYGAGAKAKDVTTILRRHAESYRVIFLPGTTYNDSFSGDPAPGKSKQLKIAYRIDGKSGEVSLAENAMILLPLPK
jgi:HEAT repeat protein